MSSKKEAKGPGTQQSFRKIKGVKNHLKGVNCSLRRFRKNDKHLEDLLLGIFNEEEVLPFLNSEYTRHNTRSKIRKWIAERVDHPVEVWYTINFSNAPVGYICFKWRRHYDRACEISTGIAKNFRGLKLGYESSKLLIDHVTSIGFFDHVIAYVHVKNKKAAGNIRKLGFRKYNRLQKIITPQFYGEPAKSSKDRVYDMYSAF